MKNAYAWWKMRALDVALLELAQTLEGCVAHVRSW